MKAALLAFLCAACVDTTGGALVTFNAAASGPADAVAGQPLETDNGYGWHVVITQAVMHIGAVYLNRSVPTSGAQGTACILNGIYNGEVRGGRDVDVLSPDPQPFPVPGDGTSDTAVTGELWLASGDINAGTDNQVMLVFAGTAAKDGVTAPFSGQITINSNRPLSGSDPAQPGAHPICKARIITPIPIQVTPVQGGTLLVQIDPRPWFANVDFSQASPDPDQPGAFIFPDNNDDQQSKNLFSGFRGATSAYVFSFTNQSTNQATNQGAQ